MSVGGHIISLYLEGIEGDKLKILLTPAACFRQLNLFAVDFSEDVPFEVQEISASSMVGHYDSEVRFRLEQLMRNTILCLKWVNELPSSFQFPK